MNRVAISLALLLTLPFITAAMTKQVKQVSGLIDGQPIEERRLQDQLPQSHSAVWTEFAKCKVGYNNDSGMYSINVTPEVKSLSGSTITVSGFVMPLDGSDHTKHFLLTRRTPVCMFCPPGEPNEVVEVLSPHAIPWTDKMVTVTGPLSLINNGEKGMFFKVSDAEVK